MRWPFLLFAAVVLLPSGCSVFVAQTGTDLSQFHTRDQVRQEFGTPDSEGDPAEPCDVFVTHRKIASSDLSHQDEAPAYFLTFGFYELYAFPRELYYTTKRSTAGQELRFAYDGAGNVTRITRDGEEMHWPNFLGPYDNRKFVKPVRHEEPGVAKP
jgi:YD repeat-containing protein